MRTHYDLIVVGAGPAGCSAALHAARLGLSVLLLDKSVFPRDKPCGDVLYSTCMVELDALGLLERLLETSHVRINRVAYTAPSGASVTVPLAKLEASHPTASVICRRVIFDDMLMSAAKERLDVLDWCAVTGLALSGGDDGPGLARLSVERGGGRAYDFTAKALVGADGANSLVARRTGFPRYLTWRKITVNGYFRLVTGTVGRLEIFFPDDVLPGYFWLYPTESGLTNVGISISLEGLRRKKINPRVALAKAMGSDLLRERFAYSEPLGRVRVRVLPTGDTMRRIHAPGVALVGDAAGLIHPCSCEGISHALLSGRLAAEALAVAIAGDHPWDNRWLRDYPENLWRRLGPALRLSDRLLALRTPKAIESLIGSARRRPHNAGWISGILLGSALPSQELDSLLGYLDFFSR